jgi:putative phosphoserine phosphatase/1-acylglycerol-3-phosphate O-acyltransferase
MQNRAVFSDLDGTLSRDFITVDFVRFLASKGLVNKEGFARHEALMKKHAQGTIPYLKLQPLWAESVALSLNGQKVEEVRQLAKEFFRQWKENKIFPSTKPLMRMLHNHEFELFLVSAGLEPLLELVSAEIGANGFVGMKVHSSKGKYTGALESNMHSEQGKAQAIKRLAAEFNIDLKRSMGFGDSIHDSAIFKSVGKPVALNPSRELAARAREKGWYIATSRTVLGVMQHFFEKGKPPKPRARKRPRKKRKPRPR